tara:strand:- start:1070 stop:1300 length:231 start_codon:yes stop_codon:yes gene_type:complete
MKYEKILETLQIIEGELDDAANQLPEYNANTDARGSIDGARYELYNLKDEIERAILDSNLKDMPGFEGTIGALESL